MAAGLTKSIYMSTASSLLVGGADKSTSFDFERSSRLNKTGMLPFDAPHLEVAAGLKTVFLDNFFLWFGHGPHVSIPPIKNYLNLIGPAPPRYTPLCLRIFKQHLSAV